jgi:23S rRNA (guanine745-N1)-methyltransferase
MGLIESGSLFCPNRHTYDITRHGYVNLLTRPPKNSLYSRELFEARQRIILNTALYSALHETIAEGLDAFLPVGSEDRADRVTPGGAPRWLADLGCGEGSHLRRVLEHLGQAASGKGPVIRGVGLDISREGILLAAKLHKHIPWLVADLAKSPLQDRSLHAVLNILSPANYGEFRRILKPGGLCVKVVPGPWYLQELRSALFADEEKRTYQNDRTVALFRQQFRLLEHSGVRNAVLLNRSELGDLARMTPLAWSAGRDRLEQFLDRDSLEITVDLEVLIGRTEG